MNSLFITCSKLYEVRIIIMNSSLDLSPKSGYLHSLQTQAKHDNRTCVVGGLVRNAQGKVFVQKRSPDRRLFPNCWDIIGGHVDPGETLYEALVRETEEETGWQLARIVSVAGIFDWEGHRGGWTEPMREFDFVIEVEGDLNQPRIEVGKITEVRWIGLDDLWILEEDRDANDIAVYEVMRKVLADTSP